MLAVISVVYRGGITLLGGRLTAGNRFAGMLSVRNPFVGIISAGVPFASVHSLDFQVLGFLPPSTRNTTLQYCQFQSHVPPILNTFRLEQIISSERFICLGDVLVASLAGPRWPTYRAAKIPDVYCTGYRKTIGKLGPTDGPWRLYLLRRFINEEGWGFSISMKAREGAAVTRTYPS